MKVKIGQIEFVDPTWEELDEIFARYGGPSSSEAAPATTEGDKGQASPKRSSASNGGTADRVVLQNFVDAGTNGVSTVAAGELVGSRGKAIKRGLLDWAIRVGLVKDKDIDPLEDCRTGTKRGVRIKASFMPVARELLANWK